MLEKRKIPISFYITLGVIIMIVFYYLGGVFSFDDLTFANVNEKLMYIFMHFWQIPRWYNEKTVPALGLGFLIWMYLIYYFHMYYRNYQNGKSHGAEEWADIKDVNRRRRGKDEAHNMILSQNVAVAMDGEGSLSNNNALLVASSGKGKTTGFMETNILRAADHMIILDVKSALLFKYGLYLKNQGYDVHSLNMRTPSESDRYNPFKYVQNDQDMIRLIENIYDSLDPPDAIKNDPFWEDGPKLYMQALFYYEWFEAQEQGRTATINNILTLANEQVQLSDKPPKKKGGLPPSILELKMDEKKKKYGPNHPEVRDYNKFINGASDTVKSIIIIVNAKFKLLELPELKRIFEDDDMDIQDMAYGVGGTKEHPTNRKVAIFLGADDTDPSLNFVFSMFYSQAANILCRIADIDFRTNRGKLPIPVGFFMDELYAGARPKDLEMILGTIRSRNIYMVPTVQSKAQLMSLYPNEKWQIILDNCATMLFYGCSPSAKETQEWISELTGDMTFDTAVLQKERTDFAETGGRLISPAAVKRMPNEDCIIFMEEEFPIYDQKMRLWETPTPEYEEAMRLNSENENGGYVHPVEVYWDEKNYRYITVLPEVEKKEFCDIDNPEFIHADLRDKPSSLEQAIRKIVYGELRDSSGDGDSGDRIVAKDRDISGSLFEVWQKYVDVLSLEEQQLILQASEEGIQEENIKAMFNMTSEEMQIFLEQYEHVEE